MSISKWIWKSLDLYAETFQRFDKVTFFWDRKRRQFRTNQNWISQLFFAFKVFCILGGTLLLATILGAYTVFLTHIKTDYTLTEKDKVFLYPLEMVIPVFLSWGPVGQVECASFMICFLGKGIAQTLNSFVDLSYKSKIPPSRGSNIAGISLMVSLILFLSYPVIIPPVLVYMKYDPYIYFIHWVFFYVPIPSKETVLPLTLMVFLPVRWILMVVVFIEAERPFPLSLAIILIIVLTMKSTLEELKHVQPVKTVKSINFLHVLLAPGMPCIEFFTTYFVIAGIVGTVLLNFIIIKVNHTLPLGLHFFAPLLQVFFQCFMLNTLPAAVSISVTCTDKLQQAKRSSNSGYLRKRLIATRPVVLRVALFGYHFFNLDKDFKSSYVKAVLDNTINILMSTPDF